MLAGIYTRQNATLLEITCRGSNDIVFLSQKTIFIPANGADPNEMLQNLAFHLGLYYLSKYLFTDFRYTKG